MRRKVDRLGRLHDRVRRLEQADDLRERCDSLAEVAEPFGEAPDRIEELNEIEHERGDRPDRDRPVAIHRCRDEQHADQCGRLGERQDCEQPDVHERRAAPRAHLRLAAGPVSLQRPLLAPERLHDANAGESFLQCRQRLRDAVPDRVVRAAGAVVEAPTRHDQDRQRDERHGGEGRREDEQRGDRQQDLERAPGDLDERVAHELGQRLDVGSET